MLREKQAPIQDIADVDSVWLADLLEEILAVEIEQAGYLRTIARVARVFELLVVISIVLGVLIILFLGYSLG